MPAGSSSTRLGSSRRAAAIPGSITLQLDARVAELRATGEDVVGLAAGQPDFASPQEAIDAACRFVQGGKVGYTPSAGLPELRAAAAAHLSAITGPRYEASQLVVTCGAKEGLFLALAAAGDPGDEVLLPQPSWLSYEPMARIADLKPVAVPTDSAGGFKLEPAALERHITPRTRAVVLNSPCNPTGSVYTRDELEALAEVLRRHDVFVISDEIYWPFVFEGEHVSPASLPGMAERTLVVNGLSKSHAMTGWRVGFLAAPPEMAKVATRLKSHITSNIATPSQHAALAVLQAGPAHTNAMREAFRRRRDLAVAALSRLPGLEVPVPRGAFYVFPRVDAFYDEALPGSVALCEALLEEARLAIVPGAAFGEDRCVRLSIAAADAVLEDGIARFVGFLAARRG